MERVCILIRTAPYGRLQAAEGLRHLIGAVEAGLEVSAILVDDGIYVAKQGQAPAQTGWISLSETLQHTLAGGGAGSRGRLAVYIHRPSAEQRGVGWLDLVSDVELIDDERLAALVSAMGAVLVF